MPLAITALFVGLAFYPAQTPKPHRVSENPSTHVADKAKPAQTSNTQTNGPSPAVMTTGKTQTKNDEQAAGERDEEIRIQWILVILTGALVLVGAVTGGFICWQAWETRRAAEATQKAAKATEASVDLQKVAMEQWIDTDDWEAGSVFIQPTATEAFLPISFSVVNTTKFKMLLDRVELWIDREEAASIWFRKQLLTPEGGYTSVEIQRRLVGVKLDSYRKGILRFEIGGVVSYVDAFGQAQKQRFGFHCACRMDGRADFESIAFDPPDAREIEAQQRRKAQTKQTNPN